MSREFFKTHDLHDNCIHGLSYADEEFQTNLTLDIDHILEWRCEKEPCEFVVAPAWLVFKGVRSYSAFLSKKEPTLNSYLAIILGVECESLPNSCFRYSVSLVGDDKLEIEAHSVELVVWGSPVTTSEQRLASLERRASNPSLQDRRP